MAFSLVSFFIFTCRVNYNTPFPYFLVDIVMYTSEKIELSHISW